MADIDPLIQRAETLLERLERLLPKHEAAIDWNARAFHWRAPGYLQGIDHPQVIELDDLHHVDRQKQDLERNTRQFLNRRPANNALLWGSRGTGKSSLIKALLTRYADQGLRLIELDKDALIKLPEVVAPLHARPERFILFTDDLSFEADDPSYKALKATLDGSIAATPENVLIYATSNRRHLLPEYHKENLDTRMHDGELHHGEAVEEKISLSERFGLWLAFHPFTQVQYLELVFHWLRRLDEKADYEEPATREAALRFALYRGSRSGRVARQFAQDWIGRQGL